MSAIVLLNNLIDTFDEDTTSTDRAFIVKLQSFGFKRSEVIDVCNKLDYDEFDVVKYLLSQNPMSLSSVPTCICKEQLRIIKSCNIIDYQSKRCHGCQTVCSGNEAIFYCPKGNVPNFSISGVFGHDNGYRYCLWCAIGDPLDFLRDVQKYHTLDCNKNVLHCHNVNRTIKLLKSINQNNYPSTDNINMALILDDYIHALQLHHSRDEFKTIFNNISKCDIKNCKAMIRNYRDRSKPSNIFYSHENVQSTAKQMLSQQILDRIHCHHHHSFDMAMRILSDEKLQINQVDSNILKLSKKQYHPILNRVTNNKFILNSIYTEQATKVNEENVYSFGNEYDYWCYINNYDHRKDKFVNRKYLSMKEELTNNIIYRISIDQFNNEYNKAQIYQTTVWCKHIRSLDKFARKCRIKINSLMSIQHLVAIMIYCNYDYLQNHFSSTFRALYSNESYYSMKRRNSNFWHLSKYLIESVYVFGNKSNDKNKINKFYHGINKELYFQSTVAIFNGPLSTSSEFEVAVNFASNLSNGLVVELQPTPYTDYYFSASWISDFSNEAEFIFIAQSFNHSEMAPLTITNITSTATCEQFSDYLKALNILNNVTIARPMLNKTEMFSDRIKSLTIQLIKHRLGEKKMNKIHYYIDGLLNYFCEQKTFVRIDVNQMQGICDKKSVKYGENNEYSIDKYEFLKDVFCHKQFEWINMDGIISLFPNVKQIQVTPLINSKPIKLSKEILDDILQHVGSKQQIQSIFICVSITQSDLDSIIDKYKNSFELMQYGLRQEKTMHQNKVTRIDVVIEKL
eukprot:38652_1